MKKPLTPTEHRIFSLLKDGLPHGKEELLIALGDTLGEMSTVRFHISRIRQKLNNGWDIRSINGASCVYQLGRMVASPYDGRV